MVTRACEQVSELVHCIQTHLSPGPDNQSTVPQFLIRPFHAVIVGLARLPLVNSYARTPPLVWKFGWMPTPEGPLKTELPPLPIEILKEKDVLHEFVRRANVLGELFVGFTTRLRMRRETSEKPAQQKLEKSRN